MPRKKAQVPKREKTPSFPSDIEIERVVQERLMFWECPDRLGRYPLPILDFLINAIGCELETGEGMEEFGKDEEFYNPSWYVKGITNGELFYSLYVTISRLSEEPNFDFFSLRIGDQQAFASMLELATSLFLDWQGEDIFVDQAVDFWILYKWTRKIGGNALWTDDNGEPIDAPPLGTLTSEDWEMMVDDVMEHFLEEGEDEYIEMALTGAEGQPHWPTFQEFRSAKAHLLNWLGRTRVNVRSD
ncbi:MAG: hypothetical protein P4L99_10795 [Chthoniobacter sp.]|nr:hypothetical protein [Chthoniobacter sp.]